MSAKGIEKGMLAGRDRRRLTDKYLCIMISAIEKVSIWENRYEHLFDRSS